METSRLLGWAVSRNKKDSELKMAIEAILFVSGEAVPAVKIADTLECEISTVEGLLRDMEADLTAQSRGVQLRRVAGGYRLFSHPACAEYIKTWLAKEGRRPLSPAALETLAIVAYRQPVSRAGVGAIRGVNSDAVLSGLSEKQLIAEVGREDGQGNAILYGTTSLFLERFGLVKLSDLPPIEGFASAESISSGKVMETGNGDSREITEGDGQGGGGL